ncbi:unnamed protein product [Schistosoma margrebowiei]|uniref:Uncharacterized protein n=1 Tax=Schistosoma margrebowiei TaxID=48269 RepID=A0A183N3W6_9TREM|nr:unnamed protein product [Schistosoma margrebowiei]
MEDVRTKRGADIALNLYLLGVIKMKLKPKRQWTIGETALQRFNRLSSTYPLNEFNITLNNKFQALQDPPKEEEATMEDSRNGIKQAPTSACQEVLCHKRRHHKEWISMEILNKIREGKKKMAINNSRTRTEKGKTQAK